MLRLPRPRLRVALLAAALLGVGHAAVVLGVALWLGYPVGPGDYGPAVALWRYGGLVVAGAVPALLALRRRLVLPALLAAGTVAYVVSAELVPPPTFERVGPLLVVENGLYAVRYGAAWVTWTALYGYAGVAEHAARRYLAVLPDPPSLAGRTLPLARRPALAAAGALGLVHALAMVHHAFVADLSNPTLPLLAYVAAGMALLAGTVGYLLVRHRLQVPFALFALQVLLVLRAEFDPGPHGPTGLYVGVWFAFLAIFLAGGGVEYLLRVAGRRFDGGASAA